MTYNISSFEKPYADFDPQTRTVIKDVMACVSDTPTLIGGGNDVVQCRRKAFVFARSCERTKLCLQVLLPITIVRRS